MNVAAWSDENLDRFGAYDAVVAGERVWGSRAVHDRACRLATMLVDRGVQPGDRVMLLLPNGLALTASFTAALRAGGVAVPVFAGSSVIEIERMAGLATPCAIVTTSALARTADPALRTIPIRLIVDDDAESAELESLAALAERYEPLASAVSRQASDPAVICYTSGTSGAPKGVVHTHGSLHARHGGGVTRRLSARVLVALPLGTLGAGMLTGRLAHQWTLILQEAFEPRAFLAAIARHRVTKLVMVPAMGEAILAVPDLASYDLTSLRSVGFTGADVPPALLAQLARVLPVNPSVAYGMTETGGGIAASGLGSKPGSVGRILKGVDVKIVGEDGTERPTGEAGEVHVRTPWMGTGYHAQPEETGAAFVDGWIRTGDIGYVDADRELFLVGRRKDLIIQGGVKVAPREVSDVIRRLPGVADCAIVGVPHALLGEQVVACVVPRSGDAITDAQILAHCRAHMDPRKLPARVWLRDALPKTPNEKINLAALRQQVTEAHAAIVETGLMRELRSATPVERTRRLERAFREQLAILPASGSTASEATGDSSTTVSRMTFGEMGLDSLRIAQLAHLLGDALGRAVAPTAFFSHPTVDALCRHLLAEIVGEPAAPSISTRRVSTTEPIAIVGAGCRLPGGADTPERFWELLRDGVDATADIARWNLDEGLYDARRGTPGKTYTRRAALLDAPEQFDAAFFGIGARETRDLDPQHRLVLEVSWEALERAGYDPTGLAHDRAGLFLGLAAPAGSSGALGSLPSMAVGRLCHFLDLRGPAMAVDTSCSSSLAAIHYAIQSLRLDECDVALAGGVRLIASPRSFVGLSEMGLMAADGRCKAFAADADGFGRGEGCVMFVLKRLGDALAARDRMHAVIRGSALRHDGRSASLTAPNGRAQQAVLRAALDDGGVSAAEVDYLEAHGTGTALGDPIEMEAAMEVLGDPSRRLVVGSVKTNIGHLETAAGAAGLLKVALALEHAEIPAHLHCRALNPLLEPMASRFVIPQSTQPWPVTSDRPRVAGVTSMGLSGTNVHVVLEQAPPDVRGVRNDVATMAASETREPAVREPAPQLLCLSARTDEALRRQAERFADHFARVAPEDCVADHCFTANSGRTHFARRAAFVVRDAADARRQLMAYVETAAADTAAPPAPARPARDDREQMLDDLARSYERGLDPDWAEFYGDHAYRRVVLPTYPFERARHRFRDYDARAREHERRRSRPVEAPQRPAATAQLLEDTIAFVRQQVADAVGRPGDAVPVDANCLDLGLDSLGVLDVVTAVRERAGIACTPNDFVSRPTVADFAAFICAQSLPKPDHATPIVVLNNRGTRGPMFCIHPAGGQVAPYLRLRRLLGDDQPLYAIPSRALDDPAIEHATIESMAAEYASLVRTTQPHGPYRLLGWSMGGLIAIAVAAVLERAGAVVELVGLVDAAAPGGQFRAGSGPERAFALKAIAYEIQPTADGAHTLEADARAVHALPRADLLAWCEAQGRMPRGVLTPAAFEARLRLYESHLTLIRAFRPPTIDAPIVEWRTGHARQPYPWSAHTRGGAVDKVIGGSHFSIMQPPHIEQIAAELAYGHAGLLQSGVATS